KKVIYCIDFKCLNCILIIGCSKDNLRQRDLLIQQLFKDCKTVQPRHVHIEKEKVRGELLYQIHRFKPIVALRHHANVINRLKQVAQFVAGELLIVNYDGGKRQVIFSAYKYKSENYR